MAINVRPVSPGDEEFLFSVYASTRADGLNLVGWNTEQKEDFLQMQFRAQDRYYRSQYPDAEYLVILKDDRLVGRLYIQRQDDEIRVMDIALLPEFQKQGIGSTLMAQILDEATLTHRPVTIHVERFNPALHLYQRLGFRFVEDRGVHFFMSWLPPVLEKDEDTRATAKQ
jgi:GNAT superfamily N-acetyltransferase